MKIIIIDGNSLINRAYYAMQRPMITKSGLYTQGVYGFLNMLNKINSDYQPDYITVAFDRKAPTFRHQEYAEYKAGRKKMPPELAMQLPLLKEVLDAMKVKMLELDGFEADDIIGTVAKRAEAEGMEPLIISGDKDELQLATKKTKVLITKKGISEFDLYDEDAMYEKYGFSPEQFIDFKGLMGDQSDNIPGIPGVGEKTALKLIQEFGSVANLIANTEQIASKSLKDKIEENAQLAIMSRRLATINTEVPIDIDFSEFKAEEPDYDALIELYIKLEFNSFLKKLQPQRAAKAGETLSSNHGSQTGKSGGTVSHQTLEMPDRSDLHTILISRENEFEPLKEDLKKDQTVFIKVFSDHNHKDVPMLFGMSILTTDACYFIKIEEPGMLLSLEKLLLREGIRIAGHSLKDDYYALLANGFAEDPLTGASAFDTAFDTGIAQYIIDPSRSDYGLKSMMLEYFHEDIEDEASFLSSNAQIGFLSDIGQKYMEYGVLWCVATEKLTTVLSHKLTNEDLDTVFYEVELPLIEVLASMERYGFAVDRKELTDAGAILAEKISELTVRIYELAGEEFNINSPIQLGPILFEKLGLPYGKKTKRGYATGIEILEKLRDDYEIVRLILDFRMYSKLKSTYIEGLLPLIHKDNKIHAHFQQTVAATGRISCTEPNLQNIPIRTEEGRRIRSAFIASEGCCLVAADYSQIDLRVLAHYSEDRELLAAFQHGQDIHRRTAAEIFFVVPELVTSDMRRVAKTINFGIVYGMSRFGLASQLHVSRKEAQTFIDRYFAHFSGIKEFMGSIIEQARADGFVTTLLGRRRYLPEINSANRVQREFAERTAINTPIQGTAADIIKLAMLRVHRELGQRRLRARLLLQIHDELVLEVPHSELDQVSALVKEHMEAAMPLRVPLVVHLGHGQSLEKSE